MHIWFSRKQVTFLVSGKWHHPPRMTRMMTGWRQLCIFRQDDARMMCAQSRMTGAERRQARMMSGWRQQDDCQDDYRQNRSMRPGWQVAAILNNYWYTTVHIQVWVQAMSMFSVWKHENCWKHCAEQPQLKDKWFVAPFLFQFCFTWSTVFFRKIEAPIWSYLQLSRMIPGWWPKRKTRKLTGWYHPN